MNDNQDRINQLVEKFESLLKKQEDFSREINELRVEIINLKKDNIKPVEAEVKSPEVIEEPVVATEPTPEIKITAPSHASVNRPPVGISSQENNSPKQKSDLEKFIGENLISKIGIAITVIGVAIGTKYSIEHDLISPLTRIILGYLVGLGLLGVGIKLKEKYESYSAVLVSGAMAIMYFITFGAYSFYSLIPQVVAFGLMVLFTAFTVVAALTYNKQVIAHIGLVGAYAVPFLLSDGSGRVAILFTYMAIINVGILAITFKRYWKLLYYSSFGLTWLIYFAWYMSKYDVDQHFKLALIFLSVFFITFYLIFIAYKFLQNEKVQIHDVALLLANSFIFYGIGYAILSSYRDGEQLLGLFTLGSAVIHFVVSLAIYFRKLADRNLFYLVSGLVLTFITIAIPVQMNGNWVTLLWLGEAVLLFWLGRVKGISIYEKLSYPLMLLAFFSILHDWTTVYDTYLPDDPGSRITPILNINFLTSMLFVAGFGFIGYLNSKEKYPSALASSNALSKFASVSILSIFIVTLYNAFAIEIATYWEQLFTDSVITVNVADSDYPDYFKNYELRNFKTIWLINYTLLFAAILSLVNIVKAKNRQFGVFNLILNTFVTFVFLFVGLYVVSELREAYLGQAQAEYYHRGVFYLGIRYVSLAFAAVVLAVSYVLARRDFMKQGVTMLIDLLLAISILWIISSELISLLDIAKSTESYKLGLSILWGVYALLLIIIGLWRKKKYLRISAIVLFGITLLKLFFYDISHLDTIAKTIVFVSLGVLLLIISFLYNKYKHIITDETDK
ncbi:MAG: DUF2339 domain-containing protein [Bacteroidales bacterium]